MQVLRDSRMKPYVGLAIRSTRPTMPTGTGLRTFFMFAKEKLVDVVAHFDFGMLWEPRTTALPATIDTVIDAAVCDAKNVHRESMGSEVGKLASVEWEFSAFAGFDNIARHPSAPHIATRLMTSKSRTGKGRPEEFFRMLSTMAAIAGEGRPVGRKCSNFIAVNAWNEWGEGNVLEPSNVLGNRMLEATKRFASELNLMPDNALIESCDTHNYGTYDPEARMNNAWFLENYQLLKRQLYHWRTKPMITLSYPHLDDWKPSFLLDKKDLGAGTVFVIGMHQTGATMLQHALHMLGYNAYQLPMLGFDGAKRCFVNDTYREAREAILFNLQGRSRMLHCLKREGLFEQYNAYVDAPFYGIVNQLVRTFRRARFIYLSRDIDEWISSTQSQLLDRKAHEDVPVVDEHGDWKLGNMKNNIHGMMYGAAHTGPRTEKDIRIWKFGFVQQMAETMRIFAHGEIDQNLLVMDLKSGDGFDVLGPFLGRPDAAEWHMPSKSLRHQHRRNATASTIVKAESHHR